MSEIVQHRVERCETCESSDLNVFVNLKLTGETAAIACARILARCSTCTAISSQFIRTSSRTSPRQNSEGETTQNEAKSEQTEISWLTIVLIRYYGAS